MREDCVVFKLDIDAPAIEIALVQQIMGDPQLYNVFPRIPRKKSWPRS